MSSDFSFTKENLDDCLNELAKEFRKRNGRRTPAEIILVGGASILLNYGFRESTTDIDAVIHASSAMREAILSTADRLGLRRDWLNADFQRVAECSVDVLREHSRYYRDYYNHLLEVRTVTGAYLLALKMFAARRYKNDISDIIGILAEHQTAGTPIRMEELEQAVTELYGSKEKIPEEMWRAVKEYMNTERLTDAYQEIRTLEQANRNDLLAFQENYPDTVKRDNLNNILKMLEKKRTGQN